MDGFVTSLTPLTPVLYLYIIFFPSELEKGVRDVRDVSVITVPAPSRWVPVFLFFGILPESVTGAQKIRLYG